VIGTTIGPYHVLDKLGEGGMGEVYRANDTNLKRTVAIKVLSSSVSTDADRVARLQREAEVLASLSHPNIATIYGLERSSPSSSGQAAGLALVMEFVDGPTLADRLAQGPLSRDEAVSIAKQIADALDAAHEQGIVHRDLKPANIKVRDDGTVKVLDFGLAKAAASSSGSPGLTSATGSGSLANSPTITSPAMTQAGMILGTAAYMSPEQARGRRVDKRADIWAFGCVLFEMLAGRPAFAADDLVATLSAVVKDEPQWSALPGDTPAALRRLLQRLLDKDPKRRARDMGDVRAELDALDTVDVSAPVIASPSRPRAAAPWILAAALAGMAAGAIAVWVTLDRGAPPTPPRVLRASLRLPPDQRIAVLATEPPQLAISPDGTRIVYVANNHLHLWSLGEGASSPVANTEGARWPFFSPDGQSVGFAQNARLVKLSLSGGVPVPLAEARYFTGGRWGADGSIVFTDLTRGIFRVESAGGPAEQLSAVEPGQVIAAPDILPGGEWVLFGLSARFPEYSTIAYSRKTKERRVLLEGGPARYLGDGYLVYAGGTNAFAVPFDAANARVTGQPVTVSAGGLGDISSNGTLVFANMPTEVRRVPVWLSRDGKASPLPMEPATYRFPRISPDGRRLAISKTDARGLVSDVWVHTVDGSSATRLTFDGQSGTAVWTSDGRRLAFSSLSNVPQLFAQDADGTGRPARLTDKGNRRYPYQWLDGNTRLLYTELAGNGLEVGVVDTRTGKEQLLLSSPANEARPDVSPDGHWIAYTSSELGRDEVFVRPFPDLEGGKWQVSTAGGHSPIWMPGGREIVYRGPGKMMSVAVHPGTPFRFDTPRALFDDTYMNDVGGRSYDVAPDGRFLMIKDDAGSVDQIEIVVNWFEELKRVMQAK
jgi:serine/threonine-protein kinase